MSGEHSAIENSIEEILIEPMDEKAMSKGVQASSMGGLQSSSSTAR
jgi:hypothetical protein